MTKKSYARLQRDRKIAKQADETLAYLVKREEAQNEELEAHARHAVASQQ